MPISPNAGLIYLIRTTVTGLGGISPPALPPFATFPYITVHTIKGDELESLTGTSGLQETIMQVNVFHKDYEAAWNVRETVKTLVLGFTGNVGNGKVLKAANHSQGSGAGDSELFDTVRNFHQLIVRFCIWWES